MDGFKKIEIQNFRGIEHLSMNDFSRVNIFLGQNNSGKSTVLEAFMMLMGMSNADVPQMLNRIRNRSSYSNLGDVRYLFRNMDQKLVPSISAKQFDTCLRNVSLHTSYVFDKSESNTMVNGQLPSSETKVFFNTLEILFSITEGDVTKEYKNSLSFNTGGMLTDQKLANGYLEKNSCAFLPSDLSGVNLAYELTALFKRKQKELILKMLQMFDPMISGIEILQDNVYLSFDNIHEMLPISMVGDGLRRYLNIVACAANPMNNVILVDEIDNGLHYSAYRHLWSTLFVLAKEENKQLFITTHSKETLIELCRMLDQLPEYQDMFRLYTIERTKLKGHQAYKYTYEGLKGACDNDVELRSIAL